MKKLLLLSAIIVTASIAVAGSVCPNVTPDSKDTIVQDSSVVTIPVSDNIIVDTSTK